jgi:hypothetical protein
MTIGNPTQIRMGIFRPLAVSVAEGNKLSAAEVANRAGMSEVRRAIEQVRLGVRKNPCSGEERYGTA